MDVRHDAQPRVDLLGRPAVHLPAPQATRSASLATPPGPFVPHRARELARKACRAWRLPDVADSVTLVADELVTNAVLHAQTFLELHLSADDDEVLVAVHDRDPGLDPRWWECRPEDAGDPRGARYGLCLVRTLAHRYGGHEHPAGGKVMWAALATDGGGGQASPTPTPDDDVVVAVDHHASPAPVRRTIVVNRARGGAAADRDRWRLDLVLGWLPDDPDHVDISLRPTPLHPALPTGSWRTGRDTLRRGLEGSAGDGAVRFHADPVARTVLLELAADRPQLVQVPLHGLRGFLAAVDAASCRTTPTLTTRGRRSLSATGERPGRDPA